MSNKILALVSVLLISGSNLLAQSFIDADSILKVAKTSTLITDRINAFNDYAYELRRKDPDRGNSIADSIYNITKSINYKEGEADYYALMGTFLFAVDLDSSKYFFNKAITALKQLDNRNLKLSRACCNLASVNIISSDYDSSLHYSKLSNSVIGISDYSPSKSFYYRVGNNFKVIGDAFYYKGILDSSMSNYVKAEQILNYTGDLNSISLCLINSANIFSLNEQFGKAVEKLKVVINLKKKIQDYQGLVLAYTNIGNALAYDNRFNEALLYIDSAMTLAKEYGVNRHIPSNYIGLGYVSMKKNNCKYALSLFQKGLGYAIEYENEFCIKSLNVSIGEALFCLNDIPNAIKYFELSLKNKDTFKAHELQAYKGLSDCYEKTKEMNKAFLFMKKYQLLSDSLYNIKKNNTINTLNNSSEVKERVKEIDSLSTKNKIEESNTQNEYFQKLVILTILVIFILLVLVLFRKYRKFKIISEQEAINKERLRIARDLHDDLGATISSISIYSTAVKQKLSEGNITETEKILDRISEDAQEIVTGMSDMLWTISSENITIENLTDRIHSYGAGLMQLKDIHFTLSCSQTIGSIKLPIEVRKNIFLIFKEAINNAVKYSEASKANFNISLVDGSILFKISDNGKGFEVKMQESEVIGNGLRNMEQRALEIHSELVIISNHSLGTVISLRIPIPIFGGE